MNIYLGDSGNIGSLSHHWRGIIVILSKLTANNREKERERTADRFSEEIACRFSAEPLWNLKNTFRSLCTEQARHSRHSQKYAMTSLTLSPSLSLSYSHEYLKWILKAHNHRDSDHLQSRISRQSISKVPYSLAVRNEEHSCKPTEKRVSKAPGGRLMSSHDEFFEQIGRKWGRKI